MRFIQRFALWWCHTSTEQATTVTNYDTWEHLLHAQVAIILSRQQESRPLAACSRACP